MEGKKMKKIAIFLFLFVATTVSNGIAGDVKELGEEKISAENRGLILLHCINLAAEKSDTEKSAMSYSMSNSKNVEMVGLSTAAKEIYVFAGVVVEGKPMIIVMKSEVDNEEKVIFIDRFEEKQWSRNFCCSSFKDNWGEYKETFSYSKIRGDEVCRMMDFAANNADDGGFSFTRKKDKIFFVCATEEVKVLISFTNGKIPMVVHGKESFDNIVLEYAEANFGFDKGSQDWIKFKIPEDNK